MDRGVLKTLLEYRKRELRFLIEDSPMQLRMSLRKPVPQRRAKIETDPREIPELRVRQVTLRRDFLVPIPEALRARLVGNPPGFGILPRRLIKMTMHTKIFQSHMAPIKVQKSISTARPLQAS